MKRCCKKIKMHLVDMQMTVQKIHCYGCIEMTF